MESAGLWKSITWMSNTSTAEPGMFPKGRTQEFTRAPCRQKHVPHPPTAPVRNTGAQAETLGGPPGVKQPNPHFTDGETEAQICPGSRSQGGAQSELQFQTMRYCPPGSEPERFLAKFITDEKAKAPPNQGLPQRLPEARGEMRKISCRVKTTRCPITVQGKQNQRKFTGKRHRAPTGPARPC